MTSAKFSDFLTFSPLVTYRNQLILSLSSAFGGPPPTADVIYGSPLSANELRYAAAVNSAHIKRTKTKTAGGRQV